MMGKQLESILPLVLRCSSLGSSEKLVLITLIQCRNSETGKCFPSLRYLIKMTALSQSSVQRALRRMSKTLNLFQYYAGVGGRKSRYIFDPQDLIVRLKSDVRETIEADPAPRTHESQVVRLTSSSGQIDRLQVVSLTSSSGQIDHHTNRKTRRREHGKELAAAPLPEGVGVLLQNRKGVSVSTNENRPNEKRISSNDFFADLYLPKEDGGWVFANRATFHGNKVLSAWSVKDWFVFFVAMCRRTHTSFQVVNEKRDLGILKNLRRCCSDGEELAAFLANGATNWGAIRAKYKIGAPVPDLVVMMAKRVELLQDVKVGGTTTGTHRVSQYGKSKPFTF